MDFLDLMVAITSVAGIVIVISSIVWIKAQPHVCQDRSEGASFDVGTFLCPPCLRAFFFNEMTREVAKTTFQVLIVLSLIYAFGMAFFYNQFSLNGIRIAFYSYVISVILSCDLSRLLDFLQRWGLTFCACGYIIVFTFFDYLSVNVILTMITVGALGSLLLANTTWIYRLEFLPIGVPNFLQPSEDNTQK